MERDIDAIIDEARRAGMEGEVARAWSILEPHRDLLEDEPRIAWAWLILIKNGGDPAARRADVEAILEEWIIDPFITDLGATILHDLADGRAADEPIPEDDPARVGARYADAALHELTDAQRTDPEIGGQLQLTLANCLRLAGPAHDAEAERAYEAALALQPHEAWWWFDFGLLRKLRGRWGEGVEVFSKVDALLDGEVDQSTLVNLAICATGAGDGELAAQAWRRLGSDCEIGADGLPAMEGLGLYKVRLSTAGIGPDHPGAGPVQFEHVWAIPRSPCHGTLVGAPMYDVGVEHGDVILWDCAPIGYAEQDGERFPRVPMLAKIADGVARSFPLRARQPAPGALEALDEALPDGVFLYVHDERVMHLCERCVREGGPHDDQHPPVGEPPAVVTGKLVLEDPSAGPSVAATLDDVVRRAEGVTLAVPSLFERVGDEVGARRHRETWDALAV